MTPERQKEIYFKYNRSAKGKARYQRYEGKHPERKEARWEPSRNARQKVEG